ncbi:MAG: acyl-CoA thioesterase [Acidobacteriota bacterium]|nr:acyl-CoA thioesterase [Acidobacteriota bacterium]
MRPETWQLFSFGRESSMPVNTHQVRVRYAETDQMGIVYYANYLVWFELGRVELLRSLGLAYSQLETEHECILPVVEARCRYRAPARYDDEILIETRPALLRGTVIKFAYRILRKAPDGEEPTLLAEGDTVHVVCDDRLNRKPLPERYAEALRAMMEDK